MGLLLLAGGWSAAQQPLPPLPAPGGPAPQPLPAEPAQAKPHGGRLHYSQEKALTLPKAQSNIRQTGYFQDVRSPMVGATDQGDYLYQLLPPGPERMFQHFQSETALREQLRQESREKAPPERAVFPNEKSVTDERYAERAFSSQVALAEPAYVNYERLLFQDINTERYGWDLGMVQPAISTGKFFFDLALLPYHIGSRPFDCIDSSAGYCQPGDPVPYLLYPPNLSVTGFMAETGAVLGAMAIFP